MTAIWHERLDTLREVIRADIARGDYFGAVLTVGRHGEVVFEEALGAEDAAGERPLRLDNVFSIFSVTKAFTNVLILKAIEEGRFALTTKVRDVLPEFTGQPRDAATFYHLLGVDAEKEYLSPSGRPVAIVREGKTIPELLT